MVKRNFKRWEKVKMATIKRGKVVVYITHLCPNCKHESLIQTNYCSECGRRCR